MSSFDFSDLKGKTVLVVGGFGFIGKAVTEGFIKVGANIIAADKNKLNDVFLRLKNLGPGQLTYYPIDITHPVAINKLIKFALKKYSKIDVFVNCSWPRTKDWITKVEQLTYKSVKKNLLDQLGSYYNCTQRVALQMQKQRSGSIINFSSTYGLVAPTFSVYEGTKMTSPAAYALIKGGVNMMTRYFASYFGKDNVRVNCVSPGGVYKDEDPKFVAAYNKLTLLGRMAQPDDLVMPVLFLASDGSRYVTGHNLVVDGGWTAH